MTHLLRQQFDELVSIAGDHVFLEWLPREVSSGRAARGPLWRKAAKKSMVSAP